MNCHTPAKCKLAELMKTCKEIVSDDTHLKENYTKKIATEKVAKTEKSNANKRETTDSNTIKKIEIWSTLLSPQIIN